MGVHEWFHSVDWKSPMTVLWCVAIALALYALVRGRKEGVTGRKGRKCPNGQVKIKGVCQANKHALRNAYDKIKAKKCPNGQVKIKGVCQANKHALRNAANKIKAEKAKADAVRYGKTDSTFAATLAQAVADDKKQKADAKKAAEKKDKANPLQDLQDRSKKFIADLNAKKAAAQGSKCPSGQIRSGDRCVSKPTSPCISGYTQDPVTKQCVPKKTKSPAIQKFDDIDKREAEIEKNATTAAEKKKKEKSDKPPDGKSCPTGFSWDTWKQKCSATKCGDGKYWDSSGGGGCMTRNNCKGKVMNGECYATKDGGKLVKDDKGNLVTKEQLTFGGAKIGKATQKRLDTCAGSGRWYDPNKGGSGSSGCRDSDTCFGEVKNGRCVKKSDETRNNKYWDPLRDKWMDGDMCAGQIRNGQCTATKDGGPVKPDGTNRISKTDLAFGSGLDKTMQARLKRCADMKSWLDPNKAGGACAPKRECASGRIKGGMCQPMTGKDRKKKKKKKDKNGGDGGGGGGGDGGDGEDGEDGGGGGGDGEEGAPSGPGRGGGKTTLTWYESHPDPNSKECKPPSEGGYNGCKWAGQFDAVTGWKSKEWVASRNIVAVHERDYDRLKNKWVEVTYNGKTIKAQVLDKCSDSDTSGNQCSSNRAWNGNGFLMDLEINTARRLGLKKGQDTATYKILD